MQKEYVSLLVALDESLARLSVMEDLACLDFTKVRVPKGKVASMATLFQALLTSKII